MQSNICFIDDDLTLSSLVGDLIREAGYSVLPFPSAADFLAWLPENRDSCALVISDVSMPGPSGYDLCRQIRGVETERRLPIILVTGDHSTGARVVGIEAGADDFIRKPISIKEILARIKSLLAIKDKEQITVSKVSEYSRFLSPTVADLLRSNEGAHRLEPHHSEVSVLFADIRGFTAFAENANPEEVMELLSHYYQVVGEAALRHGGTLGALAGDGVTVFFNDPVPIARHQEAAVRMALEVRRELESQREIWRSKGYQIDFGIGIAQGIATIGRVGFDRYCQYSVIGPVSNLAARLCQSANRGSILVSRTFLESIGVRCETEPLGWISLKGIEVPVEVHNVISQAG